MANTFQLEILASDRPFYVGPAEQLVFPTVDGLMGILPGHESMVTVVSPGELKYLVDGQWHYAAISDGFAEVRRDYVLVLGDAIELPEEIDEPDEMEEQLDRGITMKYDWRFAGTKKVPLSERRTVLFICIR